MVLSNDAGSLLDAMASTSRRCSAMAASSAGPKSALLKRSNCG